MSKPKMKQIPTIKILRRMRELVGNPKTWTSGCNARTRGHTPISVEDPAAQRFCAYGALLRARNESGILFDTDDLMWPLNKLCAWANGSIYADGNLIGINDGPGGRKKVLKAIDAAIRELGYQP